MTRKPEDFIYWQWQRAFRAEGKESACHLESDAAMQPLLAWLVDAMATRLWAKPEGADLASGYRQKVA